MARPTPAHQDSMLRAALRTLDAAREEADAREAVLRLRFLDTPAAAEALARRFGRGRDEFGMRLGLLASAHRALIVRELAARIDAGDAAITPLVLDTLAQLEVLGTPAGRSPSGLWAAVKARLQLHEAALARARRRAAPAPARP